MNSGGNTKFNIAISKDHMDKRLCLQISGHCQMKTFLQSVKSFDLMIRAVRVHVNMRLHMPQHILTENGKNNRFLQKNITALVVFAMGELLT